MNITSATAENMSYKIYNLQGASIMSGNVSASNNQISVDAISQGVYFITMTAEDNTATTVKFIKKIVLLLVQPKTKQTLKTFRLV